MTGTFVKFRVAILFLVVGLVPPDRGSSPTVREGSRTRVAFGAHRVSPIGALLDSRATAPKALSQDAGVAALRWNNGIGHSSWDLALEPDDRKRMLSLWDAIGEDLKTEKNDLAGTFLTGGYNSGYFLRWSVAKGFVVVPYFDQNLITDYGYGTVTSVDNSEVIFTPEKDLNGGRGLDRMPRKWTAILGRLVPVKLLKDFGMFRAGLGVYNEFNGKCCEFTPGFLTNRIDRPDKALPTGIPARYKHFIKDPITGTITTVRKPRHVRNWGYQGELHGEWMEQAVLIPVSINVGSRHGVKSNMLFRMSGEPRNTRYVQVRAVSSQRSTCYVVQDISSNGKEGFYHDYETDQDKPLPTIRVGIRITTSPIIE